MKKTLFYFAVMCGFALIVFINVLKPLDWFVMIFSVLIVLKLYSLYYIVKDIDIIG